VIKLTIRCPFQLERSFTRKCYISAKSISSIRAPHLPPRHDRRIKENKGLANLNIKADAISTLLPPRTADTVQ